MSPIFQSQKHINELKSKPTQLSVKQLQSMGIQPDFIVGRSSELIDTKRKIKTAYFCNMKADDIISNPDMPSIYQLPLVFAEQDFDKKTLAKLGLQIKTSDLSDWCKMSESLVKPKGKEVIVGIIAKYIKSGDNEVKDSYASLLEALKHAAAFNKYRTWAYATVCNWRRLNLRVMSRV